MLQNDKRNSFHLVEHRTGFAEVTGLNPVEALIFFRLLHSNCLNWKMYCDDHSSPSPSVELFNEEEQETKTTTLKCSVKATYIVEFVVFQKG